MVAQVTRRAGRQRGASLIEVLLAIAVAAVLCGAAVPSMAGAMTQQRLRAGSSDLYASFNLARSEAIRRGSSVAVVPADASDWSRGWTVFADGNDNGVRDADEERIVERPPIADGLQIKAHFGATFSGKVLTYRSTGRLHRPGGQGLVIGRLALTLDGQSRSLCFASLGVRPVAGASCD